MNHLLIDFDSTIPNLALMKVSAYFKAKGDNVFLQIYRRNQMPFQTDHMDSIWLSCIFTKNAEKAQSYISILSAWFPHAITHIGGTGFDFFLPKGDIHWKKLPQAIEETVPDYSLYDDDRIVGFCQRGCNRKCEFCVVHRKEGRIDENKYHRLPDWFPPDYDKLLLLDNDIELQPREQRDQILMDAKSMGIKLSLTQGDDIREIAKDPSRIDLLADNKPYATTFWGHTLYFSWDYMGIENYVRKGIESLIDAGFKGKQLTCYMLTGFNTTFEQDYHRFSVLWHEYGVYPYVMRYNEQKSSDQRVDDLCWFINARKYKSIPFSEFKRYPNSIPVVIE